MLHVQQGTSAKGESEQEEAYRPGQKEFEHHKPNC